MTYDSPEDADADEYVTREEVAQMITNAMQTSRTRSLDEFVDYLTTGYDEDEDDDQ